MTVGFSQIVGILTNSFHLYVPVALRVTNNLLITSRHTFMVFSGYKSIGRKGQVKGFRAKPRVKERQPLREGEGTFVFCLNSLSLEIEMSGVWFHNWKFS